MAWHGMAWHGMAWHMTWQGRTVTVVKKKLLQSSLIIFSWDDTYTFGPGKTLYSSIKLLRNILPKILLLVLFCWRQSAGNIKKMHVNGNNKWWPTFPVWSIIIMAHCLQVHLSHLRFATICYLVCLSEEEEEEEEEELTEYYHGGVSDHQGFPTCNKTMPFSSPVFTWF